MRCIPPAVMVVLSAALLVGCGDSGNDGNQQDAALNNNQTQARCGNGELEGNEECDDGPANSDSQADACRTTCERAHCGDGTIDTEEACDDGPANADDVPNACRKDCRLPTCGDGIVDPVYGEACDQGPANSDAPDAACRTDCEPRHCGDGIVDVGQGEACDGTHLGNASCESEGYYRGTITCLSNCDLDTSGCEGFCGDGVKDPGEVCDRYDVGTDDCAQHGFYAGTLSCAADCSAVDTTACAGTCGDRIRNGLEACDATDLGGHSCVSQGYYRGTLGCDGGCGFDLDQCSGFCGDGQVDAGFELCDGTNRNGQHCLDFRFEAGPLGCSTCLLTFDHCWSPRVVPLYESLDVTLEDLWGSGPSDLWAVGEDSSSNGVVLRYDGQHWTTVRTQSGAQYRAVWGTGPDNVYVAGSNGSFQALIEHWTGTGWQSETFVDEGPLYALHGRDTDDIYAVGSLSTAGPGTILYNNGAGWQPMDAVYNGVWNDVFEAPDGEAFVVGTFGYILRRNGSTWDAMDTGADAGAFNAIWGSSSSNVYAMGASGKAMRYRGVGDLWEPVGTPTTDDILALWGSSGADLYFGTLTGQVFHGRGGEFTLLHNSPSWITAIWGTSETNVFFMDLSTIHRQTTGVGWKQTDVDLIWDLVAVHGRAADDLYAVGQKSTVLRFQGGRWQNVALGSNDDYLRGVWVGPTPHVFAVGEDDTTLMRGVLLHWDGTSWDRQVLPTDETALQGVWGRDSDDVWAVGQEGTVYHYTTGWAPVSHGIGSLEMLTDVWGTPGGELFVAGNSYAVGPVVLHYDGGWSENADPDFGNDQLMALWGGAGGEIYVLGQDSGDSRLYRRNGTDWVVAAEIPGLEGQDLFGSAADDLYLVGYGGTILHYDGLEAAPMLTGITTLLLGGWAATPTQVWAVGQFGAALHFTGALP